MGSGTWTTCAYNDVRASRGFDTYASTVNYSTQEVFKSSSLNEKLNPYNVVRECCENEEHPNTIPIILGLDVTGSMNRACKACIDGLNDTILKLYENYKDVEIAIAGIGDFSWDRSPFQLSQFESDGRIADNLFDLYIENGGGGNSWESYTALWYAGLHHTKLDCWSRGKKGILISVGDEICNPILPKEAIQRVFGDTVQSDIETEALLEEVKEKYNVYHIAITNNSSYSRYESGIKSSFGNLLGQNLIIATSDELPKVISQIVENTINLNNDSNIVITEDGIAW